MNERDAILMFDPSTHRVGCVLLQAAFGFGENNYLVSRFFNTETWIVGEGAEKLKPYKATISQWKQVAAKCNAHFANSSQRTDKQKATG